MLHLKNRMALNSTKMTETTTSKTQEFLITKQYRRFEEFCNACLREKYIGFAHKYLPVSEEELLFILKHHWEKLGLQLDKQDFSDSEAIAAIARTTNGNFRLIHRLFSQIERIMKVNQLKSITKEVVQAARDCLVIGKV